MTKIYDGFLFNNEFELLKLRLQEHWPWVYKFILVESTTNHRGQSKPLYYADHKKDFAPWADKIQHVIVDKLEPNQPFQWGNPRTGSCEDQQRNHIPWGLYDADPTDVLLICDVDEIWRPSALKWIHNNPNWSFYLPKQILSHFRINFVCATHNDPNRCNGYMSWSKGVKIQALRHLQWDVTALKANGILSTWTNSIKPLQDWNAAVIPHGGWHFSWWGTTQDILNKLTSYGHDEQDINANRSILNDLDVIQMKLSGVAVPQIGNLFPQHQWVVCELDNYFPHTIVSQLCLYNKYQLPNPTCKISQLFDSHLPYEY